MGGFKPSRADIAGATTVGSVQTDLHQFTGSVDITGSLKLNGSSVTGGGGGGAVANYTNSGNNRVITSVDSDTINGEANLTFDGTTMEVVSTSTQAKFSYDGDSFATLTVADDSDVTLATGENGNITLHAGPSGDIFLVADGGQVNFQNPAGQNKLAIDVENASGLAYISNVKNNDLIFRVGTGVKEIFRIDQSEGALLMSGNVDNPGGLAPINFRDTATNIHSPGANRLALTAPTLEVTGSTVMSGAFGNTAVQTLNVASASVDVTTGNTIIDATGLANNTLYAFGIRDGLFTGQQKNIVFKLTFGGAPGNTNGVELTGSNIASPLPGASTGVVSVSGSDGGGGFFQVPVATTQLLWDGSDWQVLAVTNAQYGAR
jgi:phage baseplate assembly protein gpV